MEEGKVVSQRKGGVRTVSAAQNKKNQEELKKQNSESKSSKPGQQSDSGKGGN